MEKRRLSTKMVRTAAAGNDYHQRIEFDGTTTWKTQFLYLHQPQVLDIQARAGEGFLRTAHILQRMLRDLLVLEPRIPPLTLWVLR